MTISILLLLAVQTAWASPSRYEIEEGLLHEINLVREAYGLTPVVFQPQIAQAARSHSDEMLEMGYFDHRSPVAGREWHWDRMIASGIDPQSSAENIYRAPVGYTDNPAAATVAAWMKSPGHRANILKPKYTHAGFGVASDGTQLYITANFGGGSVTGLAQR